MISDLRITALTIEHWPRVEAIYAAGIATGHATFDAEPPSWSTFDTTRLAAHRFAAVDPAGRVLGWAAAAPTSSRAVYAGVVEHSVYVDPGVGRRGVGRALIEALIVSTEAAGIWTIQSGIFPENAASLRLHEAVGFEVVGIRRRLGLMTYGPLAGRWRDVIMVERRSPVVGLDESRSVPQQAGLA